MRRLVEVATQDDDASCLAVFLCFGNEAGDGVVTHGGAVEQEDGIDVGHRLALFPRVAVIAAHVVVGAVAIVEVRRVDRKLLIPFACDKAVEAASVVVEREDGRTVREGIAAQQAGIFRIERIIGLSPFLERGDDAVAKAGVVIIAHFAQRHEVGIRPRNLVCYGLEASFDDGSFLPDVEL